MRTAARCLALAVFAALVPFAHAADAYPSRPIRVIIPYSAGSVTDVIARRVLDRMSQGIGQSVVVDNRVGASGTIGLAAGVKALPDGYTLVVGSTSNISVAPALGVAGTYDPARDYVPVIQYMKTPMVLLAHPSLGVSTLKELIALAKTRAEPLHYATGGQTTTSHFVGEVLQRTTGMRLEHVPYKGATPALLAVLSGEVPLAFDFPATCTPHVKAGKLKALLVSGRDAVPLLPGVPNAMEAGYPDLDIVAWGGFLLPPGAPKPILDRLHAELRKAIDAPDMRARLREEGSELTTTTADDFRAFIRSDQARWMRIAKETGIKAQQ
ncbi:MAG: tripartite tricarboxylate transporter substrate-binding protein [Burkholderiales bacterium]